MGGVDEGDAQRWAPEGYRSSPPPAGAAPNRRGDGSGDGAAGESRGQRSRGAPAGGTRGRRFGGAEPGHPGLSFAGATASRARGVAAALRAPLQALARRRPPALLLRGLRVWDGERERAGDLRLARGRVVEIGRGLAPRRGERVLPVADHLALPGLVNAHDHLGLDLLPQLGTPPWPNAAAWAEAIHRPDESPIREMLRVHLRDRLLWGGYRNLLAGVTSVAHHDPDHRSLGAGFPVRVARRVAWAHSLGVDGPEGVRSAHRRARGRPFVLHAAEGVDGVAAAELDALERLGVLRPGTLLVHATAASEAQLARLAGSGVGVVCCPGSTRYLYDRDAPLGALRARLPVALGTDSTLSGSPTLLDELRLARVAGVTGSALLDLVGRTAARLLGLRRGEGTLAPGATADVLLLPDAGGPPDAVLAAAAAGDPALVLVGGAPRLAAPALAEALEQGAPNARVAGRPCWLGGDPAGMWRRIAAAAGDPPPWARAPLWSLLRPA